MSSDNANMPAAETSPAVAAPETSPVVVASAAPVSAEKEGSHVVAKALPNTKALATSPGGEELNELYTGSIECDVFDPIKTSGQDAEQDEQAEAATESRSFKWLLAMGMVSFLLLAALSGTVYAAFQEDGALRSIEVVTGQSDGRQTVVTSDELEVGMEVVTGIRAMQQ